MEEIVYQRSRILMDVPQGYCPGCLHALGCKNIIEVVEEKGLAQRCISINGVGCTSMGTNLGMFDNVSSLHGRAGAVATGVKRARPDCLVFTTQGDGDCSSIGIGETIHAANRGEAITVFMFNNSVYGMTGAQMAPTTLVGQKTTTCIYGRDPVTMGYPIRMAELIATLEAPRFVARCAVHRPKYINDFKKAIRTAFEIQMNEGGYSFIEVLTGCPTGVHVPVTNLPEFIDEKMLPVFPLGIKKQV